MAQQLVIGLLTLFVTVRIELADEPFEDLAVIVLHGALPQHLEQGWRIGRDAGGLEDLLIGIGRLLRHGGWHQRNGTDDQRKGRDKAAVHEAGSWQEGVGGFSFSINRAARKDDGKANILATTACGLARAYRLPAPSRKRLASIALYKR
jgi:hypothetical protein